MKRLIYLPFAVTGAAAGLLLARMGDGPARAWEEAPAAHVRSDPGVVGAHATIRSRGSKGRSESVRRRIRQAEAGTYIGDILMGRDSSLARWPDHTVLSVWVQNGPGIEHWTPEFNVMVREAFDDWSQVNIPVRFNFVNDSASADVHVSWTDQFKEPISGKTRWARDDGWWIVEGNIAIAVHHNAGEPLDLASVKAIALHEVGHLLGLDHCVDSANIMTAKVRVRELSSADRATLKLLYTLPAGTVR
jgi:predicted Zn-dependent protease